MVELINTSFFLPLVIALGIIFTAREIVAFKGNTLLKYILTPVVTFIIILICLFSFGNSSIDRYKLFIFIGLLLSLIADVLLMIEEVDLLKYGIIFFLLAHLSYIIGFTGNFTLELWNIIPLVVMCAGVIVLFINVKGKTGGLDIPVLVYAIILGLMVFTSFTLLNIGTGTRPLLAVFGAFLFMISDSLIAINGFIAEIPKSTVIVWALYAPAQLLIALSCFG